MATNFGDQDYLEKNTPEAFEDWFAARNIQDKDALMSLAKSL